MEWKPLVAFIVLSLLAGAVGSVFTSGSIESWYPTINKPTWTPPSWVFAPVWISLYILIGIAAYSAWTEPSDAQTRFQAFLAFGLQLVLNALWSIIFFGLQAPLYAFVEVVILWASIVATYKYFKKISPRAAQLLLPYLAWVSFATYLNYQIWLLN